MRSLLQLLFLVWLAVTAAACGPQIDNSKINLPPPIPDTAIGPGDVIQLEIVGEKDLPKQYQIASDGTIDLPYIHTVRVEGLEPQQVARLVREKLIEDKILTDPSVIVAVQDYNSKRVSVLGQVQKPGTFAFSQGLTLVQVLSQAGGLTAIANRDRINITRKTKDGSVTAVVSVDAITDGRSVDLLLQTGDRIYVHERVF
jgi:polysaccharide export outer membrane protein